LLQLLEEFKSHSRLAGATDAVNEEFAELLSKWRMGILVQSSALKSDHLPGPVENARFHVVHELAGLQRKSEVKKRIGDSLSQVTGDEKLPRSQRETGVLVRQYESKGDDNVAGAPW